MEDQSSRSTYYAQVSGAFDRAAQTYDELYQGNPLMAWMRGESLAELRAAFSPGSLLLEVGCGTGEEALALSRSGYRVVATDISPAMIRTARAKAEAEGATNVTWHARPAGQLEALADDYQPGGFDGAYASFGGLNCEPHLEQVAAALACLLRPGGALVCSVMNRWCAWEIGWYLLRLRPRQAFRRLGKGWLPAGLASAGGSLAVPVRYYSPPGFARFFAPHFRVQKVHALPILLPPPYLAHLFDRKPALFARLETLERRLRGRFPFYALGDHFLIVLVRTADESF
jgi:ubiquinone/menaquinone biosynthesis C-methylase UbiE